MSARFTFIMIKQGLKKYVALHVLLMTLLLPAAVDPISSPACHTSQPYAWFPPVDVVTDFDRCPCQPGEFCAPVDAGEMGNVPETCYCMNF